MSIEHRVHAGCGCGFRDSDSLAASSIASSSEMGRGHARPFALSGSVRHFERDRPFAVDHLKADLTFDFAHKSVSGTATLSVRRVDPEAVEMVLDAIGFEISKVTVDGASAPFSYDGRELRVSVRAAVQNGEIAVSYKATPRRGLYFLEPDEHV